MQKADRSHSWNDTAEIPDPVYDRIRQILKTMAGFQLYGYKNACIKRRISARIRSVGCASAREYQDYLLQTRSEPAELVKTLTINVSKFFRNPSTFSMLRDEILPPLFSRCLQEGRESLDIRSLGCASGEEPYTMAMILRDSFVQEISRLHVSIHAMDIDPEVLRVAAEASYTQDRMDETPAAIRERFFTCRDNTYRLVPEIRNMVSFYYHDMLRPTPLDACDLILCRNVLIYFERNHQEAILKRFAEALRTGGILVLGKTETLMGGVRDLYQTLCPVERIYRKK